MRKKSAFTMVELSVSLSIIALIIGAIMSGLYIKRRAELTSIMDQFAKLESAYINFKTIYNALPGDLFSASTPAFGTAAIAGVSVLYGNGNGYIDNPYSSTYEGLIALQHLGFANLIPGIYLGTVSTVTNTTSWFFKSSINSFSGYYFGSNSNTPGANFSVFDSNTNNPKWSIAVYAGMSNSALATISVVSPSEMLNLDLKYDDGYPTTGNVIAAGGSDNTSGCINTATTPKSYKNSFTKGCYIGVVLDRTNI